MKMSRYIIFMNSSRQSQTIHFFEIGSFDGVDKTPQNNMQPILSYIFVRLEVDYSLLISNLVAMLVVAFKNHL